MTELSFSSELLHALINKSIMGNNVSSPQSFHIIHNIDCEFVCCIVKQRYLLTTLNIIYILSIGLHVRFSVWTLLTIIGVIYMQTIIVSNETKI